MFELILLAPLAAGSGASSAISATALVAIITGLITVLIGVIEILKKKVFGKPEAELHINTNEVVRENNAGILTLKKIVDENQILLKKLDELHDVKDQDNIPIWYVTSTLKKLIAEVHSMISEMKRMVSDTDENSEEILSRLPELIISNHAMTLRLKELVNLLEKLANKISS